VEFEPIFPPEITELKSLMNLTETENNDIAVGLVTISDVETEGENISITENF